jgi:cobalamin biosynthesis Mg chelatase CobN
VTDRTVETLEGKVWYAAGPQVILTWPNGENHMYSVKSGDPVKFYDENGKEVTVFDLRKGMNVRAAQITEAPRTEIASATTVTGTAPTAAAAQAAAPSKAGASSAGPESKAATSGETATTPAQLPKTASPVPLAGLLGLLFTGAALCIRWYRRL